MNFWTQFAVEEAVAVVTALLASGKISGSLTPAQVTALETWLTQTQAMLSAF